MINYIFLFGVLALSASYADAYRRVCYYGSWAVYRPGNGKFDVENIDPFACTHIIYGFTGLNSDGTVRILDGWNEVDKGALRRFSGLRSKNPSLKSLIAIGGWNEGSTSYSRMAASASLRSTFIKSAISMIQTYGYDGFDLDWEYPSQRGGAFSDKSNFVTLIKEMRAEFDKHGYLLTAAVAAAASSVDLSYDVPNVSKYLHFINVMTYDLHGSWDYRTGQNAPLYASSKDTTAAQKSLTVDACIRGWIARGADPKKLNMGVGTYGRTFQLSSSTSHGLGAAATGPGSAGPYTRESGFLGYNEICENIKGGTWTVVWDDEQKVPYMYKGNQWVGFDNERSIALKVEYAKSLGLGGVMVWSVETDDFRGICGKANPLLNQIKASLGSGGTVTTTSAATTSGTTTSSATTKPPTTTTPKPTTTTTKPTTTSLPSDTGNICKKEGYVRDPNNCAVFYWCGSNGSEWVATRMQCPQGLYFDDKAFVCNYPSQVVC